MRAKEIHPAITIAARFVSSDETRRSVQYVRVERDRIWATDGHRAIVIPGSQHGLMKGAYLPGGGLDPHAPDAPPIDNVIPLADTPIAVELEPLAVTDLRSVVACCHAKTRIHATFNRNRPTKVLLRHETRKINYEITMDMPSVLGTTVWCAEPLGINVRYLLDAIDAVKLDSSLVTLRHSGKDSAVRIEGLGGIAVIMPVRV